MTKIFFFNFFKVSILILKSLQIAQFSGSSALIDTVQYPGFTTHVILSDSDFKNFKANI